MKADLYSATTSTIPSIVKTIPTAIHHSKYEMKP